MVLLQWPKAIFSDMELFRNLLTYLMTIRWQLGTFLYYFLYHIFLQWAHKNTKLLKSILLIYLWRAVEFTDWGSFLIVGGFLLPRWFKPPYSSLSSISSSYVLMDKENSLLLCNHQIFKLALKNMFTYNKHIWLLGSAHMGSWGSYLPYKLWNGNECPTTCTLILFWSINK